MVRKSTTTAKLNKLFNDLEGEVEVVEDDVVDVKQQVGGYSTEGFETIHVFYMEI